MNCRQRVLLFSLVCFCLAGCSDGHEWGLQKDNPALAMDGKFLLFGKERFTGVVNEYFDNGKIRSQTGYENGLVEGTVKTWYASGSMESLRGYHQGEKVGVHRGWWPNGKPRFEYFFSNGAYHGSFKEWYESGKPLNFFVYNHGVEVNAIGWRENGKTYINFVVRNGRKYGLTNARLCYSLKDEQGQYQSLNK